MNLMNFLRNMTLKGSFIRLAKARGNSIGNLDNYMNNIKLFTKVSIIANIFPAHQNMNFPV